MGPGYKVSLKFSGKLDNFGRKSGGKSGAAAAPVEPTIINSACSYGSWLSRTLCSWQQKLGNCPLVAGSKD